ncbi:MAG: DNA-binding protein [bacterium]|nr:DNA-binding protein [bacterium]
MFERYSIGRLFLGRFEYGVDLLDELYRLCEDQHIRIGTFWVIGAVQRSCVGFYHQEEKRYQPISLATPAEIVCCLGNISAKDEKIFIHAHISLSDEQGKVWGGHLMPGTIVFAAEFQIQELQGRILQRREDFITGLTLWHKA